MINPTILKMIRESVPALIAQDLVNAQPMDVDFKCIAEPGMTQEALLAEGYQPVSNLGLMWVKK